MKPKDLKSPFSWKERRTVLKERVLFVPDYYEHYEEWKFPGWDSPEIFGNSHPVHVEYCSGSGAWIFTKAQEHPNINWVAVEWDFERVRKIWAKMQNQGLTNLLIIFGEALTSTKHYFPSGSVDHAYINFPDPWPKRCYAKHRVVQPPFAEQIRRILKENGDMTLVTDDPPYSRQMIEVFSKCQGFVSRYPAPFFVTEWKDYGTSFFDQLWRDKGRVIHYHQFQKLAE